nr:zinc metallopeptidase [uncultured Stomatobaculum sp.]
MYGYYGLDWTYLLVLLGVGLTLGAQAFLKSTFARYAKVQSSTGLTGREVAERILRANGIYDVTVQAIGGQLTDHYDPAKKTVNLSEVIYDSRSIAALGVAAHECGHAIQDDKSYFPLRFRHALVPLANLGSQLAMPIIIIGVLLSNGRNFLGPQLLNLGLLAFSLAVLFQLVTLPVEFNASRRALIQLRELRILPPNEESQARSVLFAAALTYVAGAASSLLQLLRLWILFGGRRRK